MTATWSTDPRTWTAGETVTESHLNTEIRNRMEYVRGTTGNTAGHGGKIYIGDSTAFSTSPEAVFSQGSSQWFSIYSTAAGHVGFWDPTSTGAIIVMSTGRVLSYGEVGELYSVLRSVDTSKRHIESGTSTSSTGQGSVSFTRAFASTPNAQITLLRDSDGAGSVECWVRSVTSTGFIWRSFEGATPTNDTIMWLAEGTDT